MPITTVCATSTACARSCTPTGSAVTYQDPKNFIIVLAVEPATYMALYGNEMDFTPEMRRRSSAIAPARLVGETLATK